MPRVARSLPAFALVAACLGAPAGAAAGTGFFVGVDEDAVKWGRAETVTGVARDLGLKAVRITVHWRPGDSKFPKSQQDVASRAIVGSWGLRVVASVFGPAADAPTTDTARADYCNYVADFLRQNPSVNDVVIWNDPNDGAFWYPQYRGAASVAPADYAALLAQCWTTLHAARPAVNVISLAVSESADSRDPAASSHSTVTWYRKLGAAYRASGRRQPLFDTLGHIPHGGSSAERPWTRTARSGAIAQGDHSRLLGALASAFKGSAQPLPGQRGVTIWYLAQGFQTRADEVKARLYSGTETDIAPVPAWSPGAAADPRTGPAPDQATQLADAVRVAYCQPNVGAYFNFLLADERNLGAWQSGVLWADWSPKPSYSALKAVVAEANGRTIDCAAFVGGVPPRPTPVKPVLEPLRIENLRVTSVSPLSATIAWRTSYEARSSVAYGEAEGRPTLWAPAIEGGPEKEATLPGLSWSTHYRVRLTAIAEDGQRAEAFVDVWTPGPAWTSTAGIDRVQGALLLDGQPFFPMIVWRQCPYGYASSLAAGINLFAGNDCGGTQVLLDAVGGRALSTAISGETGVSGPGLIGYFHPDEADAFGITGATLPPPPPGVPPVSFLTLTNHFYSQAAPLPEGRGMYAGLIARSDVVGFDLYPLQEWCRPDRLADVYHSQQELVRLAAQRPTFQWIETADWRCPGGATAVTPATVRAESWLAIAGGAHGLGFFPAAWSPSVGGAISRIAREVAKLGPALLSSPVWAPASNPHVRVGVRRYQGAVYVIAVNASYSRVSTTIRVPALGYRALDVMDENRRVGAGGGAFTDTFAPLAVHVYVAEPVDG